MDIKHFIFCVAGIFIISSCKRIETVNPIPSVKFKEFKLEEGTIPVYNGKLIFTFKDEDGGDLSNIDDYDSIVIFSIITDPYYKENGKYIKGDFDTLNYNLTYTNMNDLYEIEKTGQNKTLKGEIEIKKEYYILPPSDTIRYEFYIIDIQGNKSNVDTTSEIIFNHN